MTRFYCGRLYYHNGMLTSLLSLQILAYTDRTKGLDVSIPVVSNYVVAQLLYWYHINKALVWLTSGWHGYKCADGVWVGRKSCDMKTCGVCTCIYVQLLLLLASSLSLILQQLVPLRCQPSTYLRQRSSSLAVFKLSYLNGVQRVFHSAAASPLGQCQAAMQARYSHERSVCPSVCLTNAWIVTKRNKLLSIFLHRIKGRYP